MRTVSPAAERTLPLEARTVVRLVERVRVARAGLLVGEGVALRFLEHVTCDRPASLRLRLEHGALLPAEIEIRPTAEGSVLQLRTVVRLAERASGTDAGHALIDRACALLSREVSAQWAVTTPA